MKIKRFIILVIFLLPFFGIAQKGYDPGYIITNSNDTINGFVKDRKPPPFGKLYHKIYFKNSHQKRKYGPNQIFGYKQGNREFESLALQSNGYLIDEEYTIVPGIDEKQFLKVDLRGYLTLYQMEITDPDSDYIDQIPMFKRSNENYLQRVTQGMFGLKKGKLKVYFNDCPDLFDKIENNELKTPLEIAIFYNSWKSESP